MFELNLEEGKYPIILKPSLGQPIFLNLRDFRDINGKYDEAINFNAFIITLPEQSTKKILEYFLSTYIQPVLADEGEFENRRGKRYPIYLTSIEKIVKRDFEQINSMSEEDCIALDIYERALDVKDLFGYRKQLYKVNFQIKEIKSLEKLINKEKSRFILFDLVHDLPNYMDDKMNYHSIAIFDKDWSDFKFIHATDIHVSRRNDFIEKFLRDKAIGKIRRFKKHKKSIDEEDIFILRRDFEFLEEFQTDLIDRLKKGKFNFNYNLRLLIDFINEKVREGELDCVLITGDLIDYLKIGRGNYQYENNFQVFLDILLGINRDVDKPPYLGKVKNLMNKKEIMAPIFTMVGNHDYRKGHYSIRLGKVYKIFGFTKKDVKGYHDLKFFNYFNALRSRNKYLKDYFRYININLNYKIKIKNYNFIFLDTGQDSIADMHDLLKGGPSTKGIKDFQIDLLREYIRLSGDEKIFVVMHTPPVSPSFGKFKRWRLRRKFGLNRKLEWSDFYEHKLKKYTGSARLEKILNLKYQTIMYNWKTLMKILTGSDEKVRRKVDLVLCGHTHTLKEFRLKEVQKGESETINLGFFIAPIYINVPVKIYANRYRDIFRAFKDPLELKAWFDVKKPFVLQTQAIGPINTSYKFKPPGFRYFTFANNQLVGADIFTLHLKGMFSKEEKEALQDFGLEL